MGLEAASFVNDFVTTNPVAGDNVSQGDDHLRLLKAVLKASFPNITRATYLEQARVDLASATTPDLSTPASNYINITGTTQIDGFATEPDGFMRILRFAGVLTLNYNASTFILPGGDDIVTAADDHAIFVQTPTPGSWRCFAFFRASGKPIADVFPVPQPVAGDATKSLIATGAGAYSWQHGTPAGAVVAWPHATPPTGWLECDGSAVSRTTYASLFALISDDYGPGNGSTTFNLPDYRGEFLRGMDPGSSRDPDSASRTDRGDGTTGANVGTKQADELQSHQHSGSLVTSSRATGSSGNQEVTITGGSPTYDYTTNNTGGNETRPRNVNVKWIIKAH